MNRSGKHLMPLDSISHINGRQLLKSPRPQVRSWHHGGVSSSASVVHILSELSRQQLYRHFPAQTVGPRRSENKDFLAMGRSDGNGAEFGCGQSG